MTNDRDLMYKLVVFICTLLLPTFVMADNSNDLYTLKLTELMKIKVQVASKTDQTIEKAPSTVTLFTRQDIKRLGITTVAEILNYVPGIQVTRNDSNNIGHSFQARGRFTFSGRSVLVLLDNQRLNHDWTGGPNWTNQLISTLNIKQIEVIRGPGSALYGSNAFNAVINIITDPTLNEAAVKYGSMDQKAFHIASANQFGAINTSLFLHYFSDAGEHYQTHEGPTQDPTQGYEFSGLISNDDLQLRLRYVFRQADDFYELGSLTNDINQTVARQKSISLNYKYAPSPALDLTLFGYYSDKYQKSFFQALDQATMTYLYQLGIAQDPSAVIAGPLYGLTDGGVSVDGHYQLSPAHQLSFGLSYRRPQTKVLRVHGNHELADVTAILVLGQAGQIRYYGGDKVTTEFGDEVYRTNVGLYVQDQYDISPDLAATFGLRYDYYNDIGTTTNPRASLVYALDPQHSFKFIYGEAFRAPSVSELSVRNNPVTALNPNLLPEEVATSEVAWIYKLTNFRMISTLYYSRFHNVIEHILSTETPPLTMPINAGILEVSGLEIETRQQINDTLSLDFNLSHSFKLEQDPQILARNTASFAFNAGFGQWEANLNLQYKSTVEHQRNSVIGKLERVKLTEYWLVNLNSRYKWSENIIAKISLNNLFNQDYYQTFSSAETIYNGVPNRGRQWSLSVEWQW